MITDIRLYFRGDAAFASPEMYEYLKAEGFLYAIRLPKNQILQESIGHLLTRPVDRPPNHVQRYYFSFSYQAGSWVRKRRVVGKDKGPVNRIVADDRVEASVAGTVEKICSDAPLFNHWHKKFVCRVLGGTRTAEPLSPNEEAEGFACYDTDNFRGGRRAFLAKETPDFKGK